MASTGPARKIRVSFEFFPPRTAEMERTLWEAIARLAPLRPGGRLLVVDFAPHDLEFLRDEHAHRRLGFAGETVTQWLEAAGLGVFRQQTLPPGPEGRIAVSLWLGRDPRIALAAPATREVA